ncbi:MAG: diguanylate cyclase [Alphaproteobacteria bacterium]|nr:diguanylate cyclase [Alphaproteobacteria bacterium]
MSIMGAKAANMDANGAHVAGAEEEVSFLRARIARLEYELCASRPAATAVDHDDRDLDLRTEALSDVLSNIDQGVVMFDASRRLVVWNKQYQDVLQLPDELMRAGATNHELALFLAKRGDYGPGDPETLVQDRLQVLWGGCTTRSEITIRGEKSYDVRIQKTGSGGIVITYTDVTQRNRAEAALRESESRFRDFADAASDWFWELDEELRFVMLTDTVMQYNGGTDPKTMYGLTRQEVGAPEDVGSENWTRHIADMEARRPFKNFEYRFTDAHGESHDWSISGRPIFGEDGGFKGYRGVGHDISQRKGMEEALRDNQNRLEAQVLQLRDREERLEAQAAEMAVVAEELAVAEQQMKFLANHDALTGLPSSRLATDRIGMAIAAARRDRTKCALLFMDLDGFKAVNDSLGHEAGDIVLKGVAERMRACTREVDTVARIGGDEFVVVLPGVIAERQAAELSERLIDALSHEFPVKGASARIGISIGIAFFPDDADTSDELMRQADLAMYEIKRQGKNNFGFAASRAE